MTTYLLFIHKTDPDGGIDQHVFVANVRPLCKTGIENERVEFILHCLTTILICFRG